jgi:hypothetical protein
MGLNGLSPYIIHIVDWHVQGDVFLKTCCGFTHKKIGKAIAHMSTATKA